MLVWFACAELPDPNLLNPVSGSPFGPVSLLVRSFTWQALEYAPIVYVTSALHIQCYGLSLMLTATEQPGYIFSGLLGSITRYLR